MEIRQTHYHDEILKPLFSLSKQLQDEAYLALFKYGTFGQLPKFSDPVLSMWWSMAKGIIDRLNSDRWNGRQHTNSSRRKEPIKNNPTESHTQPNTNPTKIQRQPPEPVPEPIKKEKINKKEKVAKKPKNKFSSLSSLREFEFEVTRELACKQQTTPEFVKSKLEDLENYCQRSGRVYKDYKAALVHFVKSDPHKPTYVPREKRVNRAEEILSKYRLAEWQECQGEERVR